MDNSSGNNAYLQSATLIWFNLGAGAIQLKFLDVQSRSFLNTADDLEKPFYNGFDNPERIELCTVKDLNELGIKCRRDTSKTICDRKVL